MAVYVSTFQKNFVSSVHSLHSAAQVQPHMAHLAQSGSTQLLGQMLSHICGLIMLAGVMGVSITQCMLMCQVLPISIQ